jgi:Flp pilus assembly protein TadG
MAEFAIILPVLVLLLTGLVEMGLALNNYVELTNATNQGAQALSISAGITPDPCNTASSAVFAAAPNLTKSLFTFSISITPPGGGTAATFTGTTCPNSGSNPSPAAGDLVGGASASLTVTYSIKNFWIFRVLPSQTLVLTAQTAEAVQ